MTAGRAAAAFTKKRSTLLLFRQAFRRLLHMLIMNQNHVSPAETDGCAEGRIMIARMRVGHFLLVRGSLAIVISWDALVNKKKKFSFAQQYPAITQRL